MKYLSTLSISLLFFSLSFLLSSAWQYTKFPVHAYDISHNVIASNITQTISTAYSYRINGGTTYTLVIWNPFLVLAGGGAIADILIGACMSWLDFHLDYSLEIVNVDWGGVVGKPILCNSSHGGSSSSVDCPDILIIGTTQIATRVNNNNLMDLSQFLSDYEEASGVILSNDFPRFALLDANYNGRWFAIPFISDTRLLYWNKTTFDTLGLKYPPPFGNWTEDGSWSWKDFTAISQQIRLQTGLEGFNFKGCWDEEWKILNMIAQSYGTQILNTNFITNLGANTSSGQRLKNAFEEVIIPLFVGNESANIGFMKPENDLNWTLFPAFQEWLITNNITHPESGNNGFCCYCQDVRNLPITGMVVDIPATADGIPFFTSWNDMNYIIQTDNGNGQLINQTVPKELGLGRVPGKTNFLGGSMLSINRQSSNQVAAWNLISFLLNITWLTQFGLAVESPPPYESARKFPPWNLEKYSIVFQNFDVAVPSQYPVQSFSQLGDLESRHILRYFLMNMKYKNFSYEEASEDARLLFEDVFLPACTYDDINFTISECNTNQKYDIIFILSTLCRGSLTVPSPMSIPCLYIPLSSSLGGSLLGLSIIGITMTCTVMILFFLLRERAAIRLSSWSFGIVIGIGICLCFGSVIASLGKDSIANSMTREIFLVLGFGCIFGTFALKLYRIDLIFNATDFLTLNKNRKLLADKYMFLVLFFILLGEIIVLLIFYLLGPPKWIYYNQEISTEGENNGESLRFMISILTTQIGERIGTGILLIFNILLLLIGFLESLRVRDAPGMFRETFFTFVAYTVVTLDIIIIIPLTSSDISPIQILSIRNFGILFATYAILLAYFPPKIYYSWNNVIVLNEEKQGASQEEIRAHKHTFHILREHHDALLRASANVAGQDPNQFIENLGNLLQINLPISNGRSVNLEEKFDAISMWCLPPPTAAIAKKRKSGGSSKKGGSKGSKGKGGSKSSKPYPKSNHNSRQDHKNNPNLSDPVSQSQHQLISGIDDHEQGIMIELETSSPKFIFNPYFTPPSPGSGSNSGSGSGSGDGVTSTIPIPSLTTTATLELESTPTLSCSNSTPPLNSPLSSSVGGGEVSLLV